MSSAATSLGVLRVYVVYLYVSPPAVVAMADGFLTEERKLIVIDDYHSGLVLL